MAEDSTLNNPINPTEPINSEAPLPPISPTPMPNTEIETPTAVQPMAEPTMNVPMSEPTPISAPTPVQEMPVVTTPSTTPPPPKSGSKKGLLTTGLIGLSAVAIIGVLSFSIRSTTKEATTPSQAATETTPTPTKTQSLALTFTNLKDGDVINTKSVTVTGSTNVKATVSVVGGADDVVFDTDGNSFSVDIPLTLGANKLVFTAQDTSDNQVTETRNILYSEEIAQ